MRLSIAAIILLTLTACGGSNAADPPANIVTARMLATDLECMGDYGDDPDKISCESNGSPLGITTYDTKQALKADVGTATLLNANILVNTDELWMIDAPSRSPLEAAQKIVGGKIK